MGYGRASGKHLNSSWWWSESLIDILLYLHYDVYMICHQMITIWCTVIRPNSAKSLHRDPIHDLLKMPSQAETAPSSVGLLFTVFPGGGFLLLGRPSRACLHNTGGFPLVSQPSALLTFPTTGYFGLLAKKSTQCFSAAWTCAFAYSSSL